MNWGVDKRSETGLTDIDIVAEQTKAALLERPVESARDIIQV